MFVEHNLIKNIKIFTLAFTLTVVLIQLSRFISPLAIIHSSYIFLAWMPLCVMLSILFIFGWRGVVPVLCGMFCTNLWNFHLSFLQTAVMLGSQTFVVLCACAILRWQLGTRWRYGLTSRYVWQRLFWLGLVTPIGIKCSMYLVGSFFDFPLKISTFFGDADAIFTVVDLLSLFTAVLIYNMLFYYLTRMIVSPHFAQILWRRDIAPSLGKEKRAFTLSWLAALSVLLLLLCTPYENDFIAGYLVPVFFIIFTLGVGKLRYERLKRLQADIIKIDGVFVKDIVTNTLDAMIVRSITDLAKAKSLSVVAEFVETQQQQALLHKLGVQYLQGYLIGRPQPLAD